MSNANVHCYDESYNKVVHFSHGTSLAALDTFINGLRAYSSAGFDRLSVTQVEEVDYQPTAGEFGVTHTAKILMRDTANNEIYGIMLPAPRLSMFEEISNKTGLYVRQDVGEAITALYATYSGRLLTFHGGQLLSGGRY